ncbi:hypothetical protein [Rubrivirga sp. IMCC43871]|uniref:hypothetical protein n=1 Tax=Rubrivirga sp. IMCC43871 TaxID=3391575 RepID=UPI00398FBEC9
MPDALLPIRHAYGVEPAPEGAPPGVEATLLNGMRDLLATGPAHAPSEDALSAVRARAAEATLLTSPPLEARTATEAAVIDQSLAALDRLPRSRPEPEGVAAVEVFAVLAPALTARQSPSAAAVAAVLARAAEPAGEALTAESPVEAAVLDQSLAALDHLPRARPAADTLAAVLAFAAQPESDELAAVRGVYLGEAAVVSVEADLIGQSRELLDSAFAARPQPRPSADAVALVLARAAEPAGEALTAESPVEAAVLDQSLAALDRLPRSRPGAASLDAVRLAAATASAESVSGTASAPLAPAAAEPGVPAAFLQGRFGAWAGAAALVLTALVAVVILPEGGPDAEPSLTAAVAEAAPALEDAPPAPPVADAAEPVAADPAPSGSSAGTASAASGLVAVAERVVPRPAPAPPPTTTPATFASVPAPSARTATPRAADARSVPSWEASDDVRALSLRLQEIDAADALAWDDAPAEAFGVPTGPTGGGALGLQSVRAGAPALAPARARIRPDSLR